MSLKSKFQEWLESDSYKHFIFDEGTVTHTTFIKVAKNDDFDYGGRQGGYIILYNR